MIETEMRINLISVDKHKIEGLMKTTTKLALIVFGGLNLAAGSLQSTPGEKVDQSIHAVQDKAHDAKNKIKDTATDAKNKVKDTATDAKNKVKDKAHDAKNKVKDEVQDAKDRQRERERSRN